MFIRDETLVKSAPGITKVIDLRLATALSWVQRKLCNSAESASFVTVQRGRRGESFCWFGAACARRGGTCSGSSSLLSFERPFCGILARKHQLGEMDFS